MNYLQLVQECALLIRGSNEKISQPLQKFEGAEGLNYEIIEWVRASEVELQQLHPQLVFMRQQSRLPVSAGQWQIPLGSAIGAFAKLIPYTAGYKNDFIMVERQVEGRTTIDRVTLINWTEWAGSSYANNRAPGLITAATIAPGNVLTFNAEPEDQITVQLDYRRKAIQMASDPQAVPTIPEDHHWLIVYWVLVNKYCLTRDNTRELRAKCDDLMRAEKRRFYNDQIPDFTRSYEA